MSKARIEAALGKLLPPGQGPPDDSPAYDVAQRDFGVRVSVELEHTAVANAATEQLGYEYIADVFEYLESLEGQG